MTRRSTGRGRPKGTGVNDGARLDTVAKLLAANPGMRPTTAIKAIGISDPSAIRRIREKLKLHRSAEPKRPRATAALAKPAATDRAADQTGKSPPVPGDPVTATFTAISSLVTAAFDINIYALESAFKNSVFLRAYDFNSKPGESSVSTRKKRRDVLALRQ
jgi:hypothetical protein